MRGLPRSGSPNQVKKVIFVHTHSKLTHVRSVPCTETGKNEVSKQITEEVQGGSLSAILMSTLVCLQYLFIFFRIIDDHTSCSH